MSDPGSPSSLVVDHDGVRCTLHPRMNPLPGYGVVGALITACLALAWGPTAWPLALGSVALAGSLAFNLTTRTFLVCDGRTVRWKRWGRGSRSRSVLDLRRVFVRDGWLVLDPHPGPLQQVRIDARETPRADLDRLVVTLNEALAQGEHKRGDAPGQEHWAAARMLARRGGTTSE